MANALYKTRSDIPEETLLGDISFISLADMKIPAKDMETIFHTHNIPERYIRQISPADAFRRATSSVKNRVITINENSGIVSVKIEVDEVKCDDVCIKRILGIKRIDKDNEEITYDSIAEMLFLRSNNTCVISDLIPTSDVNYQTYEVLFNEVKDKYDEWSVYHNKDTVKNIINRIISDTHPVNLMPTGLCKFVPKQSSQMLYNLKAALYQMNAYVQDKSKSNRIEVIPVIDTEEQRDLIEKNFTQELTECMFNLTNEIREKLKTNAKLPKRTIGSYMEKFKELKEKADDYNALLGTYIGTIQQQLIQAVKLLKDNEEEGVA